MPTTNPVLLKAKQQRAKLREKQERAVLIYKLGGRCVECGSTHDLQLDHVTGFKGTRRSIREYEECYRNRQLRVLCSHCNQVDAAIRTNLKKYLRSQGIF